MNVFQLGRMRWLDLLARWHLENPDGHNNRPGGDGAWLASVPPSALAALILQAREPRP
jgi:hypothetical protein